MKLSVELDAICSRNRYTSDPEPVLAELRAAAGVRTDVLAESVGTWGGFFEDDYTTLLCAALRTLPGVEPWIAVGSDRRNQPAHGTPAELGHGKMAQLRCTSPPIRHAWTPRRTTNSPPTGPEARWGLARAQEGQR